MNLTTCGRERLADEALKADSYRPRLGRRRRRHISHVQIDMHACLYMNGSAMDKKKMER